MVNRRLFFIITISLNILTLGFGISRPFYQFIPEESISYFTLLDPQFQYYIIDKARIVVGIRPAPNLSRPSLQGKRFNFNLEAISLEPIYSKLIVHSIFLSNKKIALVSLTNIVYISTFKDNNDPIFHTWDAWVDVFTNRDLKVSIFDKYKVGVDCEIVSSNNISYRKSITFNISVYDRNGFPWCLFRDR